MSKLHMNVGGAKTPKAYSLRAFVGDIKRAQKRAELLGWSLNTYIAVALRERIVSDNQLVKDTAKSPNDYFHS